MARKQTVKERLEANGGLDWIADRLLAGQTETAIAKELGCGYWAYNKAKKDLGIHSDVADLRKEAAAVLVDASGDIMDDLAKMKSPANVDVTVARTRAENLLKRAHMWDRDRFGKQAPTTKVELTLSGVFVQALSDMSALELEGAKVVEADIVDDPALPPGPEVAIVQSPADQEGR